MLCFRRDICVWGVLEAQYDEQQPCDRAMQNALQALCKISASGCSVAINPAYSFGSSAIGPQLNQNASVGHISRAVPCTDM